MDTCSIEDCDRPRRKRGWCNAHYYLWLKNGDPLIKKKPGRKPNIGGTVPERRPKTPSSIEEVDTETSIYLTLDQMVAYDVAHRATLEDLRAIVDMEQIRPHHTRNGVAVYNPIPIRITYEYLTRNKSAA